LPAFNRERVTIDKDNTTIVRRAPEEPIRQIVINVGVEGAVIVMEVKKNKKAAYGFNAATEEYMDMIEAWIIDPTKVTRTALQNAASIADRMITTECLIADKPEDDKKMGGGMGGGNMYKTGKRSGDRIQFCPLTIVTAGQQGRAVKINTAGLPYWGPAAFFGSIAIFFSVKTFQLDAAVIIQLLQCGFLRIKQLDQGG
jgi:hypothetical protein